MSTIAATLRGEGLLERYFGFAARGTTFARDTTAGSGGIKLAGIDFHDLAIGLSAALAIMIMPFTYSITNGIGFGFITYTVICAARREWKRIHPFMWIVTAAFVLYFLVPLLQQHVSWFGGNI